MSDNGWPIDLHAFPLPAAEPKHLLIELIREALGPCRKFFPQKSFENGLQSLPISNLLKAGGLIYQRRNADNRKAAMQNLDRPRDMELIPSQRSGILCIHLP